MEIKVSLVENLQELLELYGYVVTKVRLSKKNYEIIARNDLNETVLITDKKLIGYGENQSKVLTACESMLKVYAGII